MRYCYIVSEFVSVLASRNVQNIAKYLVDVYIISIIILNTRKVSGGTFLCLVRFLNVLTRCSAHLYDFDFHGVLNESVIIIPVTMKYLQC